MAMATMLKEGPTTRRASVPNSFTTSSALAGVVEVTPTIAGDANRAYIIIQNQGAVGETIIVSCGNDTNTGVDGMILDGSANGQGGSFTFETTDDIWIYDVTGATPRYGMIDAKYSGGVVS